jgi:hypothetical protein
MTIAEAIAADHTTLLKRFADVERLLPRLQSRAEVGALAAMLDGMLWHHRELETDLALLPLDRTLRRSGQRSTLARDYQQIDDSLRQARRASNCDQARRLVRKILNSAREHFREEERCLFPAIKRALNPEELRTLGERFNSFLQPGSEPGGQSSWEVEAGLLPAKADNLPADRKATRRQDQTLSHPFK